MKTLAIAIICSLAAGIPALAQSPLSAASVTVQRYDEITSSDASTGMACCAPHILESGPGADFFHVRAVFNVAFTEELDRVSINSSDIVLMLPGAAEGLRAVGHYDYIGRLETGETSLYARRPNDWPAETAQAFIDSVWRVPEGTTQATLVIGEEGAQLQLPLDLNVAPGQPVSPGSTLQATVTGFGAEAQVAVSDQFGRQDVAGRVVPTTGQALRLDLAVTPLMSTATDAQAGENQFFMYAQNFSLVGPNGMPMPYLGYLTNGSLRTNWSISSSWESEPRTSNLPLYFLGVPEAGVYTVYYFQDPVAQFNLQ